MPSMSERSVAKRVHRQARSRIAAKGPRPESNWQPADYKSAALPIELLGHAGRPRPAYRISALGRTEGRDDRLGASRMHHETHVANRGLRISRVPVWTRPPWLAARRTGFVIVQCWAVESNHAVLAYETSETSLASRPVKTTSYSAASSPIEPLLPPSSATSSGW